MLNPGLTPAAATSVVSVRTVSPMCDSAASSSSRIAANARRHQCLYCGMLLAEQDPDEMGGAVEASPEVVVLARGAVEERPEMHQALALHLLRRAASSGCAPRTGSSAEP